MLEIIQIGVSAWVVYEAVRAVTPVHQAIQPILVAAICYGLTFAPPVVLTVLCAAAVVACFRMLVAVTARPQYVSGSLGQMSMKAMQTRQRIPDLPR